jgi:hypothetical protein
MFWSVLQIFKIFRCHFGGQIVKTYSIANTSHFHADDHGRQQVLRLLDLTLDCNRSEFIRTQLVALRECIPGIHPVCKGVCNATRGEQLATRFSAAGSILTTANHVALPTDLGNLPVIRVWTGKIIRFGSRPIRRNKLLCVGGVHNWTRYSVAVILSSLSFNRASFSRS